MATPRSVPASPDASGTSPHQLYVLRLIGDDYVACCSCRWNADHKRRKQRQAIDDAHQHALDHDVQLQLVPTQDLDGRLPSLEHAEVGDIEIAVVLWSAALGVATLFAAAAFGIVQAVEACS